MFAPPPVQLTRAEISTRNRSVSATGPARSSLGAATDPEKTAPSSSLHRTASKGAASGDVGGSPGRRGWRFGWGERAVTSSSPPIAVPLPPPPPPPPPPQQQQQEAAGQHPGDRAEGRGTRGSGVEKPKTLSEAFGERPRKAPSPPMRPARPSGEVASVPDAFAAGQSAMPTPSPPRPVPGRPSLEDDGPPAIPEKSPRRSEGVRGSGLVDRFVGKPFATGAALREAVDRVEHRDGQRRAQRDRPGSGLRRNSKGSAAIQTSRRRSGSFGGKVEKTGVAGGRGSGATDHVRAAVFDVEHLETSALPRPPRRSTDIELQARAGPVPPSTQEPWWKRRQKGETMSMLLTEGFFPVQEYIYSRKNPNISIRVPFPPPLGLLNKELPDTPSSIIPTPTEMYQASPTKPTRTTFPQRKAAPKRRSPLAPIAVGKAKTNSMHLRPAGLNHELSPSRLSAIPEGSMVASENTPPGSASGVSTPLATTIHLRGGSVITLSPPELSAWKQTYYIEGPIKLPKPTILPRKGSTASMEAFQEVVDQVYQEALNIPRRRSDDQIVDDICEFFDDFCFDEVRFDGDVLGVVDVKMEDWDELGAEIDEMRAEIERFATPSNEMEATPVEKVIAKEVVQHTILLPPAETEETLRARGIARLPQGAPSPPTASSIRAPVTSRKDSTVLPLLPVPETTMLDVPPAPATPATTTGLPSASKSREEVGMMKDRPAEDQGFDWDGDVDELDALSAWVAPAALPRKYGVQKGLSTRESKNPVKRMRRLVATASAIL